MMNFCPNCGTKIGEGERFCSECGQPLNIPAAPPQEAAPIAEPEQQFHQNEPHSTPPEQPEDIPPLQQAVSEQIPPQQDIPEEFSPQQDIPEEIPPQQDMQQPIPPQQDMQQPIPPQQDMQQQIPPQQDMQQQIPPQQSAYQQNVQQQNYAPAKAKKKRRVPLFLKIIIGFILVLVLAVAGIFAAAIISTNKAANADYYEIGGEKVASVKKALGEKRKVTNVAIKKLTNGDSTYAVTYKVSDANPGIEMFEYLAYLHDQEKFSFLTDHDFEKPKGAVIQMGREAKKAGHLIVVQVDYDQSGYTVTLLHTEGTIDIAEDHAIAGVTAGGDKAEKADYYEIGGEKVASVKKVLGEKRKITKIAESIGNLENTYAVTYKVSDASPGMEMFDYLSYLHDQENFSFLSDHDFEDPTGSDIEMGREAKRPGYLIIVQVDYDQSGYTVTLMQTEGTLSINQNQTNQNQNNQNNNGLSNIFNNPQSNATYFDNADLIRWITDKTFYFEYTQISNGVEIGKGLMAVEDGGNRGAIILVEENGDLYHFIFEGDECYLIDDEEKLIYRISGLTVMDFMPEYDFSDVKVVGFGGADIKGKQLSYLNYQSEDGLVEGCVYLDEGQVYAFGDDFLKNARIITKQSQKAPAGTCELPNYKIVEYEE